MSYYLRSIITLSYWRYALFSKSAIGAFLACLGTLYLFVEIADSFSIYTKDKYSSFGVLILIAISLVYVLTTRRPVSRITYKVPKKDLSFQVEIGDLFKFPGETVISSNTTFDTDMSSGLIARNSLQGQLAIQFFEGQTVELDRQIEKALENEPYEINENRPGKKKEYPIGTVVRVSAHGKNFYLLAMSYMNEHRNAYSDQKMLDEALEKLWLKMAGSAELDDIIVPAIGTGRGRIPIPRKKIIERIAQSFADASQERIFSNRLKIVVRPEDAERFSLNLFEVRDYLTMSLHV